MAADAGARAGGILGRVLDVRPSEVAAVRWAFAYFFFLLAGYYVLRPLREEMGIRGGVETLHWSFTATFVVMLAAVPAYSALVARLPRSRAIPLVYRFFLLNLVVFWALLRSGLAPEWTARAFFVWVSVYNLFVVSVFWSFMADLFTAPQAKRLFGFVAAGGSLGAIAGPAAAGVLARPLGAANLVLVSAALLEIATRCAGRLSAWARTAGPGTRAPPEAGVGGGALAGFRETLRSPYLAAIAAHQLLFSLGATFLYFQLARVVAASIPDSARRTALFAAVDLAVSVGSLATQALATGRIVAGLGLGAALGVVPVLSAAGFVAVAAAPALWLLGGFQALRRAIHFAVDRPAREVLFTVVPREAKYKAKSFIDTFVYRGADALAGWAQAALVSAGLGIAGLAVAALPIAGASLAVALWLARRERVLERRAEGASRVDAVTA